MTNSIHSSLGDLKLSFAISQKSLFQHWDMLQFQSNSSILPISTTTQVSSEKAILSWSFFHFRVGLSLRGLPFSSWLSPMRTCDCPVCASSWPSGLLFPVPPAGTSHVRLSAFLFLSPHIQAMPHSRMSAYCPWSRKREDWRRFWSTWCSYSSQLPRQLPKGTWAAFPPFPHLEHIAICSHTLNQPSSCYISTAVSFFKWLRMCFMFQNFLVAL